jgi:AraC-like DNA-binding protein
MDFVVVPAPEPLRRDVECFRIRQHRGPEGLAINVAPTGLPGIVFQHANGQSALEAITTPVQVARTPTLFLYGTVTEPSVMRYKAGPYTTIQVVLKPHALRSLFGLNASALANGSAELNCFAADDLNLQLIEASSVSEQLARLTRFLLARLKREHTRDELVEESLDLIRQYAAVVSPTRLRQHLSISERHFERRFSQTVGVSPQAYIRIRRMNEAIRLIKTGKYGRLTEIAHTLRFYDQSHFIRDMRALAGLTPKAIAQKKGDWYGQQLGYFYV